MVMEGVRSQVGTIKPRLPLFTAKRPPPRSLNRDGFPVRREEEWATEWLQYYRKFSKMKFKSPISEDESNYWCIQRMHSKVSSGPGNNERRSRSRGKKVKSTCYGKFGQVMVWALKE